jgi:hypothetical protein
LDLGALQTFVPTETNQAVAKPVAATVKRGPVTDPVGMGASADGGGNAEAGRIRENISFFATLFGAVTVWQIILPHETLAENLLIVGAALALSSAVMLGVGAMRNRWHTWTAASVAIGVVCLGSLSVVEQHVAVASPSPDSTYEFGSLALP